MGLLLLLCIYADQYGLKQFVVYYNFVMMTPLPIPWHSCEFLNVHKKFTHFFSFLYCLALAVIMFERCANCTRFVHVVHRIILWRVIYIFIATVWYKFYIYHYYCNCWCYLILGCQTVIMHRPAVFQSRIGCGTWIRHQRSKDIKV